MLASTEAYTVKLSSNILNHYAVSIIDYCFPASQYYMHFILLVLLCGVVYIVSCSCDWNFVNLKINAEIIIIILMEQWDCEFD